MQLTQMQLLVDDVVFLDMPVPPPKIRNSSDVTVFNLDFDLSNFSFLSKSGVVHSANKNSVTLMEGESNCL